MVCMCYLCDSRPFDSIGAKSKVILCLKIIIRKTIKYGEISQAFWSQPTQEQTPNFGRKEDH